MGALKQFVFLAHDRKATKTIFQESKEAIADDIAGVDAAGRSNNSQLRDAIIDEFDRLSKWRSRKERYGIAELASRETREEFTQRIKGDVRAEADGLQPNDLLNHNLGEMLNEAMPDVIFNAVYTAALEKGRQQMQTFIADTPNAAPHEIAQAVPGELSKINFEGEAKKLIAQWSKGKDTLPDEFKEFADRGRRIYSPRDSAQDLVRGDVRMRAETEAKNRGDAVFRDAMQPALRRIAENAKTEFTATKALPLSQLAANEAAAARTGKMRLRFWKARVGARRDVSKALRPNLGDLASRISTKTVEKLFDWVTAEGQRLHSQGRTDIDGRKLAEQAISKVAEFARQATIEIKPEFLQASGQGASVDLDTAIRERAYQIWEQSGKPQGQADANWLQAESEIKGAIRGRAYQICGAAGPASRTGAE